MSFDNVINAVAVAIQARIPVLLESQPGMAKTSINHALLSQLCDEVHTSIVALHEPAEYGGFPVPEEVVRGTNGTAHVEKQVALVPNDWVLRLSRAEAPGLFLDELTGGAPATRAAAMRGIHEGVWGAKHVPNLATVAAQNPPEIAEGGYDLSPALANRFCHIDWKMPVDWWRNQLMAGFPPPVVPRLPKKRSSRFQAEARALLAAYSQKFPTTIQALPEEVSLRRGAWPSFRTWTMATELVSACRELGYDLEHDVTMLLIRGCVGSGPAHQFVTYTKELDLPDPEEILAEPKKLVLPERGDRAYAVLTAITACVLANNTEKRWLAACEVLGVVADQGKTDLGMLAFQILFKNKPHENIRTPAAVEKYIPTMKASGMWKW